MAFRVRFAPDAEDDIERLQAFLLETDMPAAECAYRALIDATRLLETFPFSCRRAAGAAPRFRELIVPFGHSGYVLLFEVEDPRTVTILAIRHQREDDYL